ncbi:uncharacterized protein LOC144663650 [Oculina patagonica]
MQHFVGDFPLFLSFWVCTVAALNTSKPSQPVTHEKAIMPCPILHDVVKKDGAYKIVYWSICTSRKCYNQHSTWTWLAGMNSEGETKEGREGINIRSDGALEIPKVRLSDTGKYMCTVKRINYRSPRKHFATLVVINDATSHREAKSTNKPYAKECKKDHPEDSGNIVCMLIVATCGLSVLLVFAVGYIVYLKRNDLRCWNQRNSSV